MHSYCRSSRYFTQETVSQALVRRLSGSLALALAAIVCTGVLAGCASTPMEQAKALEAKGQHEQALIKLRSAAAKDAQNEDLRSALAQQADVTLQAYAHDAEDARAKGDLVAMGHILDHAKAVLPHQPRIEDLQTELARMQRHHRILEEAQKDVDAKNFERAEAALRTVVAEDASNQEATKRLAAVEELRERQVRRLSTLQLGSGNKKITLEFRDASLKSVFEALSRAANLNFVFDKDVRSDTKVTLFLRGTTVEEALRVIVTTQQLNYKLLNANTLIVFPGTQQKQRDILDTVTRAFYLTNADVKQAQALVRTVAKSRDIFVDERLNLLVVRDTPEVMRLVERLLESLDVADPEVMMDVQVLEITNTTSLKLGVTPPSSVSFGTNGTTGVSTGGAVLEIIKPDPLVSATLTQNGSDSKLLASPQIRARNHEKAKVLLGEKVPVFTTSSTPTNGSVLNAVSINYLDVGVKLEVEPQVQLDNEVTIKLNLEVSSITNQVTGPDSSVAYQVGTRQASTTLRLRDGETQVLAGLINNTESHSMTGLPLLSQMPLLGRLFGMGDDETSKTQVVLLITPHVIRGLKQPASAGTAMPSGTDTMPGAPPLSLSDEASTGGLGGGFSPAGRVAQFGQGGRGHGAGPLNGPAVLGPEEVLPGASFAVTVRNPGTEPISGMINIDPSVLAFDAKDATGSGMPLTVPAGGSQAIMLRASPSAVDTETSVETSFPAEALHFRVRSPQAAASDPGNGPANGSTPDSPPEAGTPDQPPQPGSPPEPMGSDGQNPPPQ